ncbi:hypothetical protein NE237_001026 [Protea cynaroides]|uniref:Uncharacterized protein n=1 Tax=Protea cynaroides TaxID=273540 RepID=A0A9Q0KSJ9_9MAGN|nr:hypothetical protein NE237_001026 [Protea cynaroides]
MDFIEVQIVVGTSAMAYLQNISTKALHKFFLGKGKEKIMPKGDSWEGDVTPITGFLIGLGLEVLLRWLRESLLGVSSTKSYTIHCNVLRWLWRSFMTSLFL